MISIFPIVNFPFICSNIPAAVEVITSNVLRSPPWLCWPLWNICATHDHEYVPLVANTSRSFPRSWFITGFVTRLTLRVSLVEQERLTLPEHLSSSPGFKWGSCYSIFDFICMFCRSMFVLFFIFFWPLSVLLRYTDSDYPFGIFKLFLMFVTVKPQDMNEIKSEQKIHFVVLVSPLGTSNYFLDHVIRFLF